jgi:hypothetical protein
MTDHQIVVGDVLYHCYGAYAHRTHEFAIVTKITPKGKIRVHVLNKVRGQQNGDDTFVTPGNQQTGETKLLTSQRLYGRGTIQECWDFYDPTQQYVDHFDRGA